MKPNFPKHVAIIMDGNRRWARRHGLSVLSGHKQAAEKTIEPIVDHLAKIGVPYVTLWAFSTENWRRDPQEVKGLIEIFRQGIKNQGDHFLRQGYRLRVIGDYQAFPQDIVKLIDYYQQTSAKNKRLTVIFALNYGGRDEILRAIGRIYQENPHFFTKIEKADWQERKKLALQLADYLDTRGLPDPDMIIRTGGEKRLSGYLLWQMEYAELFFTPTLWPDFGPKELDKLIQEFLHRQRRFGK